MRHLIIGGGSIGKRHLKNLFFLGENELFCYRRQYDKEFEQEFHCKIITSDKEAVKLKPDAIYVCNPTSLHYNGFQLAIKAGSHTFMEKPLIHDELFLNKMIAQDKGGHLFFIGFVLRYHPLLQIIKQKLKEKVIGEIFSARFEFGSYLPNWHPGEKVSQTYAGVRSLGGGVINTITHELDLMLYLFGIPQSVIAAKANLNQLHIDVEELAEAIFRYPWGFATLHLDFLQKDYNRNMTLNGTEGKITWNWNDNKVIIKRHSHPVEIIEREIDSNQLYIDEIKDFFNLIHSNRITHPLDFDYAVANTRWMLSIHKSAEKETQWEKLLTSSLT
jgi:predicted dehydrogenase